jgi:hypothetical protein
MTGTGEGKESAEHGLGKKDEKALRDEDAPKEKEDTAVKVTNSKGKRKGGSKSESSEPADDDSDKKNIDDDVPLSFPQRVSCCYQWSYLFDKWLALMWLHS